MAAHITNTPRGDKEKEQEQEEGARGRGGLRNLEGMQMMSPLLHPLQFWV